MTDKGTISAQPHTTLCIQFLTRENSEKKQYISIEKTDLFYNSMGLCGNFSQISSSHATYLTEVLAMRFLRDDE